MTNFLIAVGNSALAKSGGNFTLTADVNFGANFGLIAKYLKSNTLNIATTGTLRLAKTDTISIRNNANTADLAIGINGSDQLTFNGLVVPDVGSTVTLAGVQTLTNKTLSTGTVISAGKITTAVNEVDSTDATKQMAVSLAGATTATTTTLVMAQTANRSITVPDATDTLVGKATVDVLLNKTLTSPTINTPTTSGEIIANYSDVTQVATPATPGAGITRVYSKSDGLLYRKTSAGIETAVGSGGLSGVTTSVSVSPAVNNTMYEVTSVAGLTITLPSIPASGGTIGILDAAGTCSATNFIRLTPATGQSLDLLAVNDSYLMDYANANVIAYAAAGSTNWRLQKQATTMVPPAVQLGSQRINTSNGYGSTGNAVRRFVNAATMQGSGFTYADSATAGGSVTITENGVYSITYSDCFAAAANFGISKNASSLTAAITTLTVAERLCSTTSGGVGFTAVTGFTGYFIVGDVIRATADGTAGSNTDRASLTIQQIAKG